MPDQATPGFKIQGAFYPYVRFDDWLLPDCRLVRIVTGYNETELISGKASARLVNVAFAAVAFHRANPTVAIDQIAAVIDAVPLDQIELVGFDTVRKDGEQRPPDETPTSSPSESSEPSSDATQETSDQSSSGAQLSESGSGSDPAT